jgi:hypothetical protein
VTTSGMQPTPAGSAAVSSIDPAPLVHCVADTGVHTLVKGVAPAQSAPAHCWPVKATAVVTHAVLGGGPQLQLHACFGALSPPSFATPPSTTADSPLGHGGGGPEPKNTATGPVHGVGASATHWPVVQVPDDEVDEDEEDVDEEVDEPEELAAEVTATDPDATTELEDETPRDDEVTAPLPPNPPTPSCGETPGQPTAAADMLATITAVTPPGRARR